MLATLHRFFMRGGSRDSIFPSTGLNVNLFSVSLRGVAAMAVKGVMGITSVISLRMFSTSACGGGAGMEPRVALDVEEAPLEETIVATEEDAGAMTEGWRGTDVDAARSERGCDLFTARPIEWDEEVLLEWWLDVTEAGRTGGSLAGTIPLDLGFIPPCFTGWPG